MDSALQQPGVCEACRQAPVSAIVPDGGPDPPYQLCRACAYRLRTRSLRPLEWYNLAALYGPSRFHLHDDFYWKGEAEQPEAPVEHAEQHPMPALVEVRDDLGRLLDHAMTHYSLFAEQEIHSALSHRPPAGLLDALVRRVETSRSLHVRAMAYEICGWVLGSTAADWIRREWLEYRPELLDPLAVASAGCLPLEEGWSLVTHKLLGKSRRELSADCNALAYFRSSAALEWIEDNVALVSYDSWGRLAAASHFSWPTAQAWLNLGRPLSLVALPALYACSHYDTPLLRHFAPVLEESASVPQMLAALEAYVERDNVRNTRNWLAALRQCWTEPEQ